MKKETKFSKLAQADGREKPPVSKIEAVSSQKPEAAKKCVCKIQTIPTK